MNRHRGAGWEAIRSHLGRTCPRHESDGLLSFSYVSLVSATESEILSVFVVTFLTRRECRLCEQARPLVAASVRRLSGQLIELDIDSDTDLARRFGARIPVVLSADGEVVAEGRIDDERALRRSLKRAR